MKKWNLLPLLSLGLMVAAYAPLTSSAQEGTPADVPVPVPAIEEPLPFAPVAPEPITPPSVPAPPPSDFIEIPGASAQDSAIEITQSEDENKISIQLNDVPLRDVIQMFSRISNANIVASGEMEGRVTVSLNNVHWRDALESILETADLAMVERRPSIFSIVRRSDLASEPLVVETIFLNFVGVTNVLPVVRGMLVSTNSNVTAAPAANALIITETQMQINAIKEVIARLDKPRPQVFIESKFVELNDQAIEDLGIDWQVLQGYTIAANSLSRDYTSTRQRVNQNSVASLDSRVLGDSSASSNSSQSSGFRERATATGLPSNNQTLDSRTTNSSTLNTRGRDTQDFDAVLSGRNFDNVTVSQDGAFTLTPRIPFESVDVRTAVLTAEQFALTLSALKQTDGAKIVSNPMLLVSNGEKARIHVGRNEPNVEAVPVGELGDRFAFQLDEQMPFIEIGIKLEVTPTINTEDNITLKIVPELSRLIGQKTVGESNTSFPITQIRRIQTEFNLPSGRTVAIGGLTETTEKEVIKKVPVLGDIPIIGKYLFSHKHTENLRDEVIIFVTVQNANPEKITDRSGLPSQSVLIQNYLEAERIKADQVKQVAKTSPAKPDKAATSPSPNDDDRIKREVDEILQKYRSAPAEAAPPTPALPADAPEVPEAAPAEAP